MAQPWLLLAKDFADATMVALTEMGYLGGLDEVPLSCRWNEHPYAAKALRQMHDIRRVRLRAGEEYLLRSQRSMSSRLPFECQNIHLRRTMFQNFPYVVRCAKALYYLAQSRRGCY